jgi:hypothetical protein
MSVAVSVPGAAREGKHSLDCECLGRRNSGGFSYNRGHDWVYGVAAQSQFAGSLRGAEQVDSRYARVDEKHAYKSSDDDRQHHARWNVAGFVFSRVGRSGSGIGSGNFLKL